MGINSTSAAFVVLDPLDFVVSTRFHQVKSAVVSYETTKTFVIYDKHSAFFELCLDSILWIVL